MSDRHYEVYALVEGRRVTLHTTDDRREAQRFLADAHQKRKNGGYAPEVQDVGLFIPDWKLTNQGANSTPLEQGVLL